MTPESRGRRWAVEQCELGLRVPQILPDFDEPQSMAQRSARGVMAMAERWLAKRLGADRRASYTAARSKAAELLAAAAVTREAFEDMREAVARGTTGEELLVIIMPLWRRELSTSRRRRLDRFVQAHRPAVLAVLTDFLDRWAEARSASAHDPRGVAGHDLAGVARRPAAHHRAAARQICATAPSASRPARAAARPSSSGSRGSPSPDPSGMSRSTPRALRPQGDIGARDPCARSSAHADRL